MTPVTLPNSLVNAHSVNVFYDCQQILCNINLTVRHAEVVALIGRSGCGKTTLLNAIMGFVEHTGVIQKNSNARIGLMFQKPLLQPWHTARQHIEEATRLAGSKTDVMHLLSDVGLEHAAHLYPNQLSGGMQQRLALARVLSIEPDLLMLDEPFSNVDEITREFLYELLGKLVADKHLAVLFVTHSLREAVYLSDRILVLSSDHPSTVKNPVSISTPRPRTDAFWDSKLLFEKVNEVRHLLRVNTETEIANCVL